MAPASQKVVKMRTFALLTMLALSLAAVPMVIADHGADGHETDDDTGSDPGPVASLVDDQDPQPTVDELLRRIAELEALVAALAGGQPGEAQQPCSPGVGCFKFPFVVDEIGDTMTGDLNLSENARLKFLPEDQQQDALTPATVLGPFGFDINAPTNFSKLVKLHDNATLNTTGGAKLFIDHDGNLTFADGSFLNPAQGFANQNWTFTNDVNILQNLTIHEGANIVFQNNTGFLQAGNFSRIGTTTDNEFVIIANNETAIVIHPGPTQADAASIVAGHPDNNITADTIGNFIAGGGSAAAPNLINGSWGIILGGSGNSILGDHGTAGGQDTAALHDNSFAWGDGNGTFQTTAPKTFIVNATGGVGINTNAPVSPLTVGGNITPDQDGVFSLGTPTHRWHQLYMASEIDFVTELLYTSGGATVMSLDAGGNLSFTGALSGDASGLTGISATSLEDGSITTGKLADGAVTAAKMGEVCPVGNVLKSDGSGWACGADLDTDTTYSAGTGLALNGTTFTVDSAQVQNRVASGCEEGSSIRLVNQDGTVVCEVDDDSNTDTLAALSCTALQVAKYDDLAGQWVCAADDDTTYGAGFGLDLQGTTFDVSTTDIQRRVASTCAEGSSIRVINQDGTVACETDTDTTYTAGEGLALSGQQFHLADCLDVSGNTFGVLQYFEAWECRKIGPSLIDDQAVRQHHIRDGAVRQHHIADGHIVGGAPSQGTLPGSKIGLGTITGEAAPTGGSAVGNIALGTIGSENLANGAVTGSKIADGAVGLSDLGMDCAVGEVVKRGEATWVCAADDSPTSMDWNSVTGKPAGFADDTDDDTLASLNCSTDQIARWNGKSWTCAADTMPPRPGPGTIVGPFDADRDVAIISTGVATLCYVDENENRAFNTDEPLYLHFDVSGCEEGVDVSQNDLRLVAVGGHAAFSKVLASDADAGKRLSTYMPDTHVANLRYFDRDGNAAFTRGDSLYADGDVSGAVSLGNYRWTGSGGHEPGTIVRSGDSDVGITLRNLTSLSGKVALWDLDGDGAASLEDLYYVSIFGAFQVTPNQTLRLGDLGAV